MPVEQHPQRRDGDRSEVSHLEAVARLLCGLAPWFEQSDLSGDEETLRAELCALAQQGLQVATDPSSRDYFNFAAKGQPLVEAAFLSQAFLRAPNALWKALDDSTRQRVVSGLKQSRGTRPSFSNWLLFSALVETALSLWCGEWDQMRVDYALRQHEQWYLGDGAYGDGPRFHWDYYNSFVIQPALVEISRVLGQHDPQWQTFEQPIWGRAQRYAVVLERSIAPDGSFPAIGRSLAYRCGAFHALAQMALLEGLPNSLAPAGVRGALTAVIQRTLTAPNTFDENGWLRIGLSGHQPNLGEGYISTGSLYLCTSAFLPLGLSPQAPFWSDAPMPFTSQRIWNGEDFPADHAMGDDIRLL